MSICMEEPLEVCMVKALKVCHSQADAQNEGTEVHLELQSF